MSFIIEKALSCEYLIVSPFLFVNVMIVFVFSKDFLSTNLFEVIEFEVIVLNLSYYYYYYYLLVTLLLSKLYRIYIVKVYCLFISSLFVSSIPHTLTTSNL